MNMDLKNKYGVRESFVFDIYQGDTLVFTINTTTGNNIRRNFDSGENYLYIDDALLDLQLVNDILSGKYDDRELRIEGNSVFRDAETLRDVSVKLDIKVAKLVKYYFNSRGNVSLEFFFPTKEYVNCDVNFVLSVVYQNE